MRRKRIKRYIRGCCKRRAFWTSSGAVSECLTNGVENITDLNGDCITS